MKLKTNLTLASLALTTGMAQAALVTWNNGGADTNWNTSGNWDTGTPNINGTDNVLINTGDTVTYNPGGDFDPGAGSTITVSGGSSVVQSAANWQRSSGGTLTLDNGTWSTASVVRNAYDSGVNAGTINLLNGSSYTVAGEFWVTRNDSAYTNVSFDLNISGGSSADFNGAVGVWFWDAEETGNDYNVNFSGDGSIEGRIGYQSAGGTTNNSMTWEALWDKGVLQWNGANAGSFGDYFITTGSSGNVGYKLIATTPIPEPSSTALLGLGGLALILRRRK